MRAAAIIAAALLGAAAAVEPRAAGTADGEALVATDYRLRLDDPYAFRFGAKPEEPAPPATEPKPFADLIEEAARRARLEPALVHAVIHVESRHNPGARSPKGAVGLMQVMPQTAARYGVRDPGRSVHDNVLAGTRYLRDLLDLFGGRLDLALAAYNAGEHAVIRHGGRIPPYRETRQYVPAVLETYQALREPPPPAQPPARRRIEYLPGTVLELAPEPRR
jgi:soluble lytic murein transglycosylase-like protein